MNWANLNLLPALPEIFLLSAALVILLADLFISDRNRGTTCGLSLLVLAATALLSLKGLGDAPVKTFNGMYVADSLSAILKAATCFGVGVLMIYSRKYAAERGMYRGELFTLMLFATLGMMVMISASHFLSLYMGLELLSLAMYALVALQRDSVSATEASMKYFVLGALASGMLLYGISMVYGATGSLDLAIVAQKVASGANRTLLVFGLVFIVTGLGFKFGAVPFHMWVPDVYHGAPTVITALIGSMPKMAAMAFALRILGQGLEQMVVDWREMLIVLSVLSMFIGNVTAIAQTNLKRMLAYSTISHMGFLLLGLLAGSQQGYAAAMFYAVTYTLTSLAGFGIILLLSRKGFEADSLEDLKGLNKRNPWFALMMLFVMFSMAGIPPLAGFYAKFAVLKAVVELGGLVWLAVAAVMFSLIGAFYYLRIVKLMYMDEPTDEHPIEAPVDMRMTLSVNALAILALGIMPERLMALCIESIRQSLAVL